jgi:drug/metabolite transporter (DMT)-like permease
VQWLLLILAGVMYGSGTVVVRAAARRRTTTWGLPLGFSLLPCLVGSVIGLPHLSVMPPEYMLWPVLLGVLVIVGIWATAEALQHGPVSPVFLIRGSSLSLPVAASILVYGEPLGVYRAIGLAVAAVALVLLARRSPQARHAEHGPRTWVAWSLLGMACFGAVQIIMRDAISREVTPEFLWVFIMLSFWGNVAGSLVGLAASRQKPTRGDLLWGLPVGLTSIVGFSISMFVLRDMGGVLVFPSRFLITSSVVILSGLLLFKEHPDRRTALGMALGIVGIILLAITPG